MNGMAEYDDTLEPDSDIPCPACDHFHDCSVTCEENLQEERLQAAIDRMEEKRKDEPRL